MAPHSSTLAWKIPWMEEPGRLQSMGSLRVGHDSDFTFTFPFHALEKEMATHSSVLALRIRDGGASWAAVYGDAQSDTTEATQQQHRGRIRIQTSHCRQEGHLYFREWRMMDSIMC